MSTAWDANVRSQATRSFRSVSTTAANALGVALQRDADLTATARALVESTPDLTNADLATWFRMLGTRKSYAGSFGLLYIENVRPGRLATFGARALADPPLGIPAGKSFHVTPNTGAPYCLTRAGVVQLTPGNLPLPPNDLQSLLTFTKPTLNYCGLPIGSFLEQTETTGKPAAVALTSLVAALPHEAGVPSVPAGMSAELARSGLIAVLTPAYRGDSTPSTAAARRASSLGWIFSIYQADSILQPVLQASSDLSASLAFSNPDGSRSVLATTGPRKSGALTRTFRLAAMTDSWTVTLSQQKPTSGFPASAQGVVVFLAGFLLSTLLAALIWVLSRSRARALDMVAARTAELRFQALHDGLTGLPNRELIFDRAQQMLTRARRDDTRIAALFVDLDGFKDVNDSYGHGAGDELLREVARRFVHILGPTDTVGRLGGDEFVVLVEETAGSPPLEHVAERILSSIGAPFELPAEKVQLATLSASIGIAAGSRESAGDLLRNADIALYEAKAVARGGYVMFHPRMQEAVDSRLGLEAELRSAIREEEFFLVYQPTFTLDDQRLIGAEALLRWRHPERGVVGPVEFIPTLESTGLIVKVGEHVLRSACRQAAQWASMGHPIEISVNVSGRQLDREDIVSVVERALADAHLEPELLTLEITETTLMHDPAFSARRMRELKALGVNIAIDDFGTGYCSLAYLQQFPVDCLKIDQSFIAQMMASVEGRALVRTIIQMGKDLNLSTLAEGIEDLDQLVGLRADNCTKGQGFFLARPLEVDAVEALLFGPTPARSRAGSARST